MDLICNATPLRRLLRYFDELGIDERSLKVGHIDRRLRGSTAPLRHSARLTLDLLEAAALRTGRADFGLQFGIWLDPRGIDVISLLWEQARSVSEWYGLCRRYIHLENNALAYELATEGENVALIHDVVAVLRPRATHFTYAFVVLTLQVFRTVIGSRWNPVAVEFRSARPADTRPFRRFFRCPLRFGAERTALVVRREDFERELPGGNPNLMAYLEGQLARESGSWSGLLEDQIEHVLMSELSGRPPTLAQLAERFAMSPRTLQRRLAQRGTSYGELLTRVRREVAGTHLQAVPRTPLAQLAAELGFADATQASRFMRAAYGGEGRASQALRRGRAADE